VHVATKGRVVLGPCESVWKEKSIYLGESLRRIYLDRIEAAGLVELASDAASAKGEPGGASKEESDKHFAWRFANSAGRSIYALADPEGKLQSVHGAISESFVDGDVVLVDIPSGSGAGALGILACIFEHRKAGAAATLPLNVTIVAGDFSARAGEHFDALFEPLRLVFASQAIFVSLARMHWDAMKIDTSAALIDQVIEKARSADRVFLLVSNFSAALKDRDLKERFEHFVTQFSSRVKPFPNSLLWIEPNTSGAKELLPKVDSWIERFIAWFKGKGGERVKSAQYNMCDPFTEKVYLTGIVVLRCGTEGLPWST